MVALLTKTEIQSLYIDTVEKALVFGALVLRAALVGSDDANADNLNAALNLSAVSDTEGNLNLEIYIPYSAYILNSKGGKLLDAVGEYQSNSPNLLLDLSLESLPTSSGLVIPDYPESEINTVEKYLVYYAQILWASVANKRSDVIALTFLGNQDEPQLLISVNLPLNLDNWLNGFGYLNSISTVVESYASPSNLGGGSAPPGNVQPYSTQTSNPIFDTEVVLHTVTTPGVLLGIDLDAVLPFDTTFYELVFTLNGETISYAEAFEDFAEGFYEWDFANPDNPILLSVGDTVGFKYFGFDTIGDMDWILVISE